MFVKIISNSSLLCQRKLDVEKELQTSISFLNTVIERNNNVIQNELIGRKRASIDLLNDTFERMITCIRIKQEDLIRSINSHFSEKTQEIEQNSEFVQSRRDIIQRNYSLIKNALNSIPETMLTVEE